MPKTKKNKAEAKEEAEAVAKVEIAEDTPEAKEPETVQELKQEIAESNEESKSESKMTTRHPALDLVKKPTGFKDSVAKKMKRVKVKTEVKVNKEIK